TVCAAGMETRNMTKMEFASRRSAMEFVKIVNKLQGRLDAHLEGRICKPTEISGFKPNPFSVPWSGYTSISSTGHWTAIRNWVAEELVSLLEQYPSGITETIIFSELELKVIFK